MSKKIVNRVANSGIITIDLSDYIPKEHILELDLKQFLFDGFILKEVDFRTSIKEFDFSIYKNKVVAVFCSSDCIIPMWAFMLVTSHLTDITSEIVSGNREIVFQQFFLRNIENINPANFQNKKVIVKGCGKIPLKESLYVAITKKLKKTVSSLMFGEACSAVPVYKKK
tara:strand:+ start:648 stop:1154 length:507 start_codon:yes stop_codon:yes gene_type:complete